MDQKSEQMFARGATPPGVSRKELGATTSPGVPRKPIVKKKKKILPLLLYHRSVALVNRFLKTFFIKFSVSSIDFKKFLWYNIYGERDTQNEQMFGLPPNPQIFYYIIKGAALSSIFAKIF